MTTEEQLARERRWAPRAAASAIAAAVLLIVATVYLQVALEERPDGSAEALRAIDREGGDFVVSGAIQGVALLLIAPVLLYLYRAARHRRPQTPSFALYLALAAPVGLAVLSVVRQVMLTDVAADFVAGAGEGADPDDRADDAIEGSTYQVVGNVTYGFSLALGVGVLLISLNAMRAGLTSRFLGILGIIIGVLYALPQVAGGPQIVQLFWLGALAALFLDRYPGGRGPAWGSGEPDPWPSAVDRARAEEAARAGGRGGGNGRGPAVESADPDVPRDDPRPASRKRKRKRR